MYLMEIQNTSINSIALDLQAAVEASAGPGDRKADGSLSRESSGPARADPVRAAPSPMAFQTESSSFRGTCFVTWGDNAAFPWSPPSTREHVSDALPARGCGRTWRA